MLIFTEDLRDKLFDAEITTALKRALQDEGFNVTESLVEFFTAAMAQGALRSFHGITRYSHQNIPRGVSGQDI